MKKYDEDRQVADEFDLIDLGSVSEETKGQVGPEPEFFITLRSLPEG